MSIALADTINADASAPAKITTITGARRYEPVIALTGSNFGTVDYDDVDNTLNISIANNSNTPKTPITNCSVIDAIGDTTTLVTA